MGRLEEIEARLSAIQNEINTRSSDITAEQLAAFTQEVEALKSERAGLLAVAEQRTSLLANIAEGRAAGAVTTRAFPAATTVTPEQRNAAPERIADSPEYRDAFFRHLLGREVTPEEMRDLSSASGSAGAAVPTQTANEIITKVKELAPLLDEVTLLHVAGNVTFAVENTVAEISGVHTENGQATADNDTLLSVTLAGYELVKLVRISATVRTMSINAFEAWIVDMLAERVALSIEHFLIKGTGSSQPKGIDALTYTDTTNGVDYAAAKPTAAEIFELIGYLPARHARNGKFLMRRSTLWNALYPLRDDGKYPIVKENGQGGFTVCGYPVMFSDEVDAGDIFFGNYKMIVANLAEDIKVNASEHSAFAYNAIDYRGTAIFDSDIADDTAFVKGAATL